MSFCRLLSWHFKDKNGTKRINEPRHEKTGFLHFCICENKDADQLRCAFVFASQILQSVYFLNPKFQVSSYLLWLYSPVCVGPGDGNPEDQFSHNEVQMGHIMRQPVFMVSDPVSSGYHACVIYTPLHHTII